MTRMATARIPDELYEQGIERLNDIGSSASALIKAAFEYIAIVGELPTPPASTSKNRKLSASERIELNAKITASQLQLNLPDNWDYRDEIATRKWAEYEALS